MYGFNIRCLWRDRVTTSRDPISLLIWTSEGLPYGSLLPGAENVSDYTTMQSNRKVASSLVLAVIVRTIEYVFYFFYSFFYNIFLKKKKRPPLLTTSYDAIKYYKT